MGPRAILGAALAFWLWAPAAQAWPASLMERLARDARRLLPAALNRLLAEREDKIFEAAAHFPVELQRALAADLERGALRPETIALVEAHLAQAPRLMRDKRVS